MLLLFFSSLSVFHLFVSPSLHDSTYFSSPLPLRDSTSSSLGLRLFLFMSRPLPLSPPTLSSCCKTSADRVRFHYNPPTLWSGNHGEDTALPAPTAHASMGYFSVPDTGFEPRAAACCNDFQGILRH